jgi:hypothetical protein
LIDERSGVAAARVLGVILFGRCGPRGDGFSLALTMTSSRVHRRSFDWSISSSHRRGSTNLDGRKAGRQRPTTADLRVGGMLGFVCEKRGRVNRA